LGLRSAAQAAACARSAAGRAGRRRQSPTGRRQHRLLTPRRIRNAWKSGIPSSRAVLGGDCDPGSTQAGRLSATTCGYPLIVEAALKNRASSFVIDGEAMQLADIL